MNTYDVTISYQGMDEYAETIRVNAADEVKAKRVALRKAPEYVEILEVYDVSNGRSPKKYEIETRFAGWNKAIGQHSCYHNASEKEAIRQLKEDLMYNRYGDFDVLDVELVKPVNSSTRPVMSSDRNYYDVNVNFGGYIGADKEYGVYANSEEEAEEEAFEEAREDLEPIDIIQVDDTEWEVTIGFDGLIGVEETYTVYGEDEDEAIENAIEEASYDLNAEVVS